MGGHNQGDRRKLNMNEGIVSKTLLILALTVLAQSAIINTSGGQEDVEDTRSIDGPDQKRGDDHFLRFAKKSYLDNDFDDIFSKRGGDDHFLRFAKRDSNGDHFLRFAKPDDHFLRFAKADDHFLRFAKSNDDHMLRFSKKESDDHFLRFAKRMKYYLRGARDLNEDHMLRFA